MSVEKQSTESVQSMETENVAPSIVLRCIDFRTGEGTKTWLVSQNLQDGEYFLYASAGSSGNANGFLETVASKHHSSIRVIDHQDCGYYKKMGDDDPQHHKHNMEILGDNLRARSPNLDYQYHFLPIDDNRHDCPATAIILGRPDIVKAAREKLDELGLANDHDEIARPYELSVNDDTLWTDLEISLSLHHPKSILIFDENEDNAKMLLEKAKEIAPNAQVELKVLSTVS